MTKLLLFLSLFSIAAFADLHPSKGSVDCTTGSNGQVYTTNGTSCSFTTASGTGTFNGPGSSTAHNLMGFLNTSGAAGEDSGIAESAVCTLTGTQALTNKTLTSPTVNGATWGGTTATGQGNGKILETDGSGNLTAATLITAAQLPNPTASTIGGVESIAAVSHNYLTSISTSGVPAQARPAWADLSDPTLSLTQLNNLVTDSFVGHLEAPTAKTYYLDFKAAYPYTINTLDIATVSGTATVAVKIGGTNVTGISAVSVSSTPATGTASGANTVSAGNQVTFVVSSISSPVDMAYTLKVTRN